MKRGLLLSILAAIACLAACSDSSGPDPVDNDLRGQVVDAQGQPVAGARVVLEYEVDIPLNNGHEKPATVIRIDLPAPGPVTIWISSFCDDDTLRMLADGTLPEGVHAVSWDGRDDQARILPDGVYRFHVVTTGGETHRPVPLFHLGYHLPDAAQLAPLAVTDAQGRFALGQACLPLGFTFDAVDENGEVTGTATITRTVKVWVYDPRSGTLTAAPAVSVDSTTGAEVTVTIGD